MAAHDTHKPAGGSPFDLDEDLFNFPVIELGPEGLRDPAAVAAAEAEAAKTEAAKAAAAAPPAPLPSAASAGSSEKTLGASTPSILPVTPVSTAPKSNSESKESKTAAPVAPVAEMGGAKWRVLVAALVGLFLLNGGVFFYLYRSSSTFGAGIEDLRAELGDATVRLDRARDEIKERGNAETFTSPYAVGETIDALERQAVAMAETEIATGDYGAARRRLYRLLAQADRMPASLRAELEPRASYLIARSYHVESEKRAEVSR